MKSIEIENLKALKHFAKTFASELRGGEVIGLVGDLGAGKTAFVKEVAAALGVRGNVKSPTFVLMQLLECDTRSKKRGIAHVCHVDAYRLEDSGELEAIGFRDYAGNADTVTFVEWADRVPEIHQILGYQELTFSFGEGDARNITFSA